MKRTVLVALAAGFGLAGCQSAKLTAYTSSGETKIVTFYSGNRSADVPDLLIIDGKNYFGKSAYQMDDPFGDIGFRLEDGRRVQAECAEVGKNSIDKPECKSYRVYRSDFDLIPVDTIVPRPAGII